MLGRRCFARTGVHSTMGCCMDLGPARTRPTFMPSQCSANVRKWPNADVATHLNIRPLSGVKRL